MRVPQTTFYNGQKVPIVGIGTWKSKPGEVTQAVKDAIDIGYRHIDCAFIYGNEKEIGEAIKAKIDEGVVKREDLFITSKLWNTFHDPKLVEGILKESLKNLGTTYLDLYLIHWPVAYKSGGDLFPKNENGDIQFDTATDYVDTWLAMEEVCKKGLTKSIGLSNFNKDQIDRVLMKSTIKPAMLQIECHPYLNQAKLIEYCTSKNIKITAYSPLGSRDRPWAKPEDPDLMNDPKIQSIAQKYKKTPAQILLKYQLNRNVIVIPKSVNKSRIAENFQLFDFDLKQEDIDSINTISDGVPKGSGRFCPLTAAIGHPYHPFKDEVF